MVANNKIGWCFAQKKGLSYTDPSAQISQDYVNQAMENLDAMHINKGIWKVVIAYYACYLALYAILRKIGIKSEIHECTIAIMEYIDGFSPDDIQFLQELKMDRIDAQYYMRPRELKSESAVKEFVLKCRSILLKIDAKKVLRTLKEAQK